MLLTKRMTQTGWAGNKLESCLYCMADLSRVTAQQIARVKSKKHAAYVSGLFVDRSITRHVGMFIRAVLSNNKHNGKHNKHNVMDNCTRCTVYFADPKPNNIINKKTTKT